MIHEEIDLVSSHRQRSTIRDRPNRNVDLICTLVRLQKQQTSFCLVKTEIQIQLKHNEY